MLNRRFNHQKYYFSRIEEEPCDLGEIFRHKDSLGWFIAFLKVIKNSIDNSENIYVNINDIIENLCYIYDSLDKKYKNNSFDFPILL